jgi:hypothetical protein
MEACRAAQARDCVVPAPEPAELESELAAREASQAETLLEGELRLGDALEISEWPHDAEIDAHVRAERPPEHKGPFHVRQPEGYPARIIRPALLRAALDSSCGFLTRELCSGGSLVRVLGSLGGRRAGDSRDSAVPPSDATLREQVGAIDITHHPVNRTGVLLFGEGFRGGPRDSDERTIQDWESIPRCDPTGSRRYSTPPSPTSKRNGRCVFRSLVCGPVADR